MSLLRIVLIVTAASCFSRAAVSVFGQAAAETNVAKAIAVEEIGEVEAIENAEHRLGGTDRIFLIEDQWEFDRCALLLPKLPIINLETESLLVVMSWKYTPRKLLLVQSEKDTLVIKLGEGKPPGAIADSYHPPKFLVFKLPAWKGPVRIEVNGEPRFTILRDKALVERSKELWDEILRIHSGGGPKMDQRVRYYKRLWRDTTDQEIRRIIMTKKDKYRTIDLYPLYLLMFRDLSDIRATPTIPRLLDLIESMGQHDKALGPACDALVGIGGSEVVAGCKESLTSWNPRCRAAAMGVLATLALPETRDLAREKLADLDRGVSGNALIILRRIGIGKDDVPSMIHALERTEKYYLAKPDDRPKLAYFDGETAKGIIYAFGELGPAAQDALPILERFATDPNLPIPGFQSDAKQAIEKIMQAKRATP